jgi:hypothetical protein
LPFPLALGPVVVVLLLLLLLFLLLLLLVVEKEVGRVGVTGGSRSTGGLDGLQEGEK